MEFSATITTAADSALDQLLQRVLDNTEEIKDVRDELEAFMERCDARVITGVPNSFQVASDSIIHGTKATLTMAHVPAGTNIVRQDGQPLYYYGTTEIVQAEQNIPVTVSAEDLIAGVELTADGTLIVKFYTHPLYNLKASVNKNEKDIAAIKKFINMP